MRANVLVESEMKHDNIAKNNFKKNLRDSEDIFFNENSHDCFIVFPLTHYLSRNG
jgi:hypothetical protein